ncbi:MAG TPA: glutamate mutase [Clostridiales bacterium]|nr:glutamate mutase [Clostridiales bacterium]
MNIFDYLIIDIGSTYTKQRLFKDYDLIASVQSPTTVNHVLYGINDGQSEIREKLGIDQISAHHVLSSSSAAGGLRMVAIGFMMRVTAKAAKEVAMNSGSKILEILSNENPSDYKIQVLREINPDIILLAGGTDGGDEESILNNASLIVESNVKATVVLAGNLYAQRKVANILRDGGVAYIRVPNIMPTIHELRVKEAREEIHKEFIKQIIKAQGLNAIQQVITNDIIIPTPGAVLMAAELLGKGTYRIRGLGSLIVVDLGGATTDVHSVVPEYEELDAEERGLVVTNEKQVSYRTVEGNIGMRVSAMGVLDAVDPRLILERRGLNTYDVLERFMAYCSMLEEQHEHLAQNAEEEIFDELIAQTAIEIALKRHAGRIATEADAIRGYLPGMPMGRDLRMVKTIIGVGGVFAHNKIEKSKQIIQRALKDAGAFLLPKNPQIIIDQSYLLFAAGCINEVDADYAMEIMKRQFIDSDKTNKQEL